MGIRDKITQAASADAFDAGKLRTLALRALLFDEITTSYRAIATADSPYTINTTFRADVVVGCDATSGNITVNLPSAALVPGRHYWVVKIGGVVGNRVTVVPAGSDKINGVASFVVGAGLFGVPRPTVHFMSTGAAGTGAWIVLGAYQGTV